MSKRRPDDHIGGAELTLVESSAPHPAGPEESGRPLGATNKLWAEYGDWEWTLVWMLSPEVVTHRISSRNGEVRYLKAASPDWFPSLESEARRMVWARQHLPVPPVIEVGSDSRSQWLVTEGLRGKNGVDPYLAEDPQRLVRILARGLRSFHEAPVGDCPFDFSLDTALAWARRRLESGMVRPEEDFHSEFAHLSAPEALDLLERTRPESESLVVCHGDYCPPNILIEGGAATGFVDLGELGVADRWWDLAVATWSVTWNFGPGMEEIFLREYGIERDQDRIEYYRLLYDVVS